MIYPPKPTGDQCQKKEIVYHDGQPWLACWYPQMGGYTSCCLVSLDPKQGTDACFGAYVWHDGEFPFDAVDGDPAVIHHCSAVQFIEFGLAVIKAQKFTAKRKSL